MIEKETAYSNLMRSVDELLLMASAGIQEDFIQRVSSAVCESMRNEQVKDYDTIFGRHETILTNFLKTISMVVKAQFLIKIWGIVTALMKNSKAKTIVSIILAMEKGIMVLIIQINYTINHTMIVIVVHPVVTKEMDSTTMANIDLHHGEVEDDIMSQDPMMEKVFPEMKAWEKLLVMKGIKQIVNPIKSLTIRSLQGMTPK